MVDLNLISYDKHHAVVQCLPVVRKDGIDWWWIETCFSCNKVWIYIATYFNPYSQIDLFSRKFKLKELDNDIEHGIVIDTTIKLKKHGAEK